MKVKTVIFDFDSTLINCESLEVILQKSATQAQLRKIEKITQQGMNGTIGFKESLEQRLDIAQPKLQDVVAFGNSAHKLLTAGIKELISELQAQNIKVWIVSGGFIEAILPVAKYLNIPNNQVKACQAVWDTSGSFIKLDANCPFNQSKIHGCKQIQQQLQKPCIAIGDGMTDYDLYKSGIANKFIAFSQHVRRAEVISLATTSVNSTGEFRSCSLTYLP